MENPQKIINGFCYLKDDSVVFVDLYTDKSENYKRRYFDKFINDNDIDEYCIFLSNREGGLVTPLFKYKLNSVKTKERIKANTKTNDDLIDLCYKICIEMFKKAD
jgi:hypothetical protein